MQRTKHIGREKGRERKGRETTGFLGHHGEKQEEKANHKMSMISKADR
jgi:hypothetical protein